MIATKARGFQHVVRLANGEPRRVIFFDAGSTYPREGLVCSYGNEVYFLNSDFHNTRHAGSHEVEDLMRKYNFSQILCFDKKHLNKNEYFTFLKYLYVLPADFDEQYDSFLSSNKKLFAGLPNKIGYGNFDNAFSKFIFAISDGSKNFFQWAHNCRAKHVSVITIEQILRWNENYSQLAKNLRKGTITAYTNHSDLFGLIDEQIDLRRAKRVQNTINMFNTQQKKLLKEVPFSPEVYEIMSRFNRLSSVKQNNFIRKMSTVDNAEEILHQMSFLVDTHFKWNKESFLEYIKNNEMVSAEIIYDKGDIILVQVKDYDTIKRIAKNTSWCISKNKTYWNNYMSKSHIAAGTKQYVLFDFSKKEDDIRSIVGFTLNTKKGITASHDFVNNNILDRRFSIVAFLRKRFNTLVPNRISNGGIHSILLEKGIDVGSLLKNGKIPYLWNADSFIKHLISCLGDDRSFDVLSECDGRMAILVENPKIEKFLGDAYASCVPNHRWGNEHIIFADFNESADNPNKLMYGVIIFNDETKEWCCDIIRNGNSEPMPISFDSLLDEYDLPYDIICRTDNKYSRVINAFTSYDVRTLRKLLKDSSVIDELRLKRDSNLIYSSIHYVISSLISDEFIKVIYESGITLSDILDDTHMAMLCDALLSMSGGRNIVPTQETYERLLKRDGSVGDSDIAETVAGCYMLEMILENERKNPKAFAILMGRLKTRDKCLGGNAFIKNMIKKYESTVKEQVSSYASKDKRNFF